MKIISKYISLLFILLLIFGCKNETIPVENLKPGQSLVRVKYNNPEAIVDLGVGLWAHPLPMDYDDDGDMDLLISCKDVPFNGLYFFENTDGSKLPVFNAPVRIGPAIRNVQVSFIQGKPRILIPGLEILDISDSTRQEVINLFPADSLEKLHKRIRFRQWKYTDYEGDGDLDIIAGISDWEDYGWDNAFDESGKWTRGPLHGYVYLIENEDDKYNLRGKIQAGGKDIDVYGAPSPNLADFDNDGDLDIICGEFIDKMTWFENTGTRSKPVYASGRYLENENGLIKMDLEMIVPVAVDWDGDGDTDLIVGDEDGRAALVENMGKVKNHMPVFSSPVYFRQKAGYVKFGALATPVSTDWDDDGDEDIITGNSAGYIGFIENLDGGNPPAWAPPEYLKANGKVIRIIAGYNGSIQGPCEEKWGYTTLSVADWDGDGLRDIIVNSIWGKVIWFKNTGQQGAPKLSTARPVKVKWNESIPKPEWNWWDPEENTLATQWRTTPYAIDWNKDGLMDLVMLDHEGFLSYFERFNDGDELFLKPGKHIFFNTENTVYDNSHHVQDTTSGPLRLNNKKYGSSGRVKLCIADWNMDNKHDLLLNSMSISLMLNEGTKEHKIYFKDAGMLSETKLAGHTTSPTIVDWNKDGVPDLLVGAEDGHFYYLQHP